MKELLFLMLLVFSIQCANNEPKENCGIVTETVTVPSDTKSKSKSVPISYYSCEYVVIMPQGKDSLEVVNFLAANNFVLKEVSKYDPLLRVYSTSNPINTDTIPPPINPIPPPPIKDRILSNSLGLDLKKQPTTLFKTLSNFRLNQKM